MNVINVGDIERELKRCASYAVYPAVSEWVTTVARNHILARISDKDRESNFILYTGEHDPAYADMPARHELPNWAKEAVAREEALYWFDTIQVRRRNLWQAVEQVVHWFNGWAADDRRMSRLSRIDFETAASAAAMWFCDVQTNLWDYVKDKPPVVYRFENGFHWVKMVTPLHFERESRMMNHCVGNGTYFNHYQQGWSEYYSLRDSKNEPHATMEVTLKSRGHDEGHFPRVNQCKGKGNAKPAQQYQPYIYPFVFNQKWPIYGDGSNIDQSVPVHMSNQPVN